MRSIIIPDSFSIWNRGDRKKFMNQRLDAVDVWECAN